MGRQPGLSSSPQSGLKASHSDSPLPSILSTLVCTAPSPRQTGLQSKEPRLFAAVPQQSGEAGMGVDSRDQDTLGWWLPFRQGAAMEQLSLVLEGKDVGLVEPEAAEQGSALREINTLVWGRVGTGSKKTAWFIPKQPC